MSMKSGTQKYPTLMKFGIEMQIWNSVSFTWPNMRIYKIVFGPNSAGSHVGHKLATMAVAQHVALACMRAISFRCKHGIVYRAGKSIKQMLCTSVEWMWVVFTSGYFFYRTALNDALLLWNLYLCKVAVTVF